MAVTRKTINFLPEIFRSDVNRKFLGSTLDQLISEPNLRKINGFIGRQFSASVRANDNFILETSAQRQNYQLEPAVVTRDNKDNVDLIVTYPDLVNKINYYGGVTNDHNRLFDNEYYNFDPHIDLDKFVNFSNYHWITDPLFFPIVTVGSLYPVQQSEITFTKNGTSYITSVGCDNILFPANWNNLSDQEKISWYNINNITESTLIYNGYSSAEIADLRVNGYIAANSGPTNQCLNPTILIVRNQQYKFTVNHAIGQGNLWIQTEPSTTGFKPYSNVSVRNIDGVSNNGISSGNILINIPSRLSQVDLLNLETIVVDLAIDSTFTLSDNATWANTSVYPDNKLVVFTSNSSNGLDWVTRTGTTLTVDQRRGIYRARTVTYPDSTIRVEYAFIKNLSENVTVKVTEGKYKGFEFVRNSANLDIAPTVTSPLNTLYYQNDIDNTVGQIRIINNLPAINVLNDIIGAPSYTSPNGVEFINGLRIRFNNTVNPARYRLKEFIVEGVGKSIKLLDLALFKEIPPQTTSNQGILKIVPDYITINRASMDHNTWSRSNQWVHVDVLNTIKKFNPQEYPDLLATRATRPIIEFEPDLQLYNHGRKLLDRVTMFFDKNSILADGTLINDITTQIQGRSFNGLSSLLGYNINPGDTAIFNNDIDPAVRNRIYVLDYVDHTNATIFDLTLSGSVTGYKDRNYLINVNYANQTKFDLELNVGDSLFTSGGVFIGRVTTIVSSSQITIDRKLSQDLIDVTNIQVKGSIINLKVKASASLYQGVYVVGPKLINPNSRGTFVNSRTMFHWDRKIYADPESVVPEVVYSWAKSQNKEYNNQEPLFDIVTDNSATFLGTSNLNLANLSLGEKLVYNNKKAVFSDQSLVFRDTKFVGTKLFSYQHGSARVDPVLGFGLAYNSINGFVGDIKFVNNFDTDSFEYRGYKNGLLLATTEKVNVGYIRKNTGLGDTDCVKLTVWSTVGHNEPKPIRGIPLTPTVNTATTRALANEIYNIYINYLGRYPTQVELDNAITTELPGYSVQGGFALGTFETGIKNSLAAQTYNPFNYQVDYTNQMQHIAHVYDGYTSYFDIDVAPRPPVPFPDAEPNIKLFINNRYVTPRPGQPPIYNFQQLGIRNTIKIDPAYLETGDKIDILISAPQTNFGYYQIPQNLEFNSQNRDILNITHGQMRGHLERIAQNIQALVGQPLGISNIYKFDLNNRGGTLLQHSAPIMYSALFLVDEQANLLSSIDYARREYTRFKNKFLETVLTRKDVTADNIPDIVDNILYNLNKDKNPDDFAFFYSDMLAYGKTGNSTKLTILNPTNKVFDLQKTAGTDFQAILIYHNNKLLVNGVDYNLNGPLLTLSSLISLQTDDEILVKYYNTTDGSYIPETPTKLGLYPKYLPGKFIDNTLGDSGVYVIQGHDGSLTIAFNDYRDDVLLELENRIYNNLKVDYDYDRFDMHNIIPGRYRRTDYGPADYNRVLNSEFLKWAGFNHLDYAVNVEYTQANKFTYNYSRSQNELGQSLPGHWRGIYKFYYDTDRPHTHPWEMLGHSIKPIWWDTYYSWNEPLKRSALIIAITEGYTENPGLSGDPIVNLSFKRNGFSNMVPVDTSGNLIAPIDLMVRSNDSSTFNRNYVIGDHGPAETAWRRSSEYPFALQRALSLLKPARYFALNIDITRYNKKTINDSRQFILANHKRPSSVEFIINGEADGDTIYRSSSYINWIHGYLTNLGIEPINYIKQKLKGLGVNLAHKLGGFSDKKYLNVFAEQFSPSSIAENVIIPDENYQIYLNKSVPTDRAVYSAVIIEKTSNGYSVTGYDQRYPYFTVIPSETAGSSYVIEVLNKKATIFTEFRSEKIIIPYGFEFDNYQQVVDFLISYQRFLIAQGFVFDQYDSILQVPRDWVLSAKEFLTWEMQGWETGNVLVLSPVIDKISITSNEGFVDEITNQLYQSRLLGANFNSIRKADFTLLRDSDITTIKTVSGQTIALADINLVEYEHILIFDDVTVFNDLIYNQTHGNRQFRLKLIGSKTNLWDGTLMPAGFVYTDKLAPNFSVNKSYNKGDIVTYKNKLYTAIQKIEASNSFNMNYWKELDSTIESGIVPNFAQLASRSQEIYDIDNLPLDEEFIKFSGSLIGYRTRPYLTELGLNETSQIKFYQGFIKDKGTYQAIDGLARGDFDNINNDIEIYEEWGARIGVFGGIDINPEISVPISESLTVKNPMVFEFLDFKQNAESSQINVVYPNQLLLRPYDYNNKLFLNRNENNLSRLSRQAGNKENKFKLAKIEMFGDGIICGQEPTDLVAYTITAVENFSYDVEIYGQSSYAIRTLDQKDSLVFQPETINSKLTFDIGSLIDIENLEYVIEPAGESESQLSVSTLAETQIKTLLPGQPFRISIRSVSSTENLTLEIEPPNDTDALNQNEIGSKLVTTVTAALNESKKVFLRFIVTGVENTENLFYTIEDYSEDEDSVLSSTFVEYGTACVPKSGVGLGKLNREINRVDFPPDILLYEELQDNLNTSIITRSVGGSTSGDLLTGKDMANARWPDDIEAEIVIINHGLNDAKKNISIPLYKENLKGLRSGLPRDKVIVWVLPTQPNMDLTTEGGLPDPRVNWNRAGRLALYINAMREVAITNGDYIADTTNIPDWQKYFSVDPVFPTQEGYRALVKHAIAPAIKRVIKDRNRSKSKTFENDIKSAGYVILEEVNELVFDITKFTIAPADIEKYTSGYKIWVAKDLNEDWQVYRMYQNTSFITGAKINLDNRFDLMFDHDHEYKVNDLILVKGFADLFDGLYRILSTGQQSVTVQGTEKTTNFLQFNDIDTRATHFDFQKLRFDNIDQRDNAQPKHGWQFEDFIYVDDNGFGNWEVFRGELDRFSNIETVNTEVIYTEKYDITATSCGDITVDDVEIINTAGINEQIHFNISSVDDSEDLYYTIEEVNEQEEAAIQIEKFFYLYLDRAPDIGTYNYYLDLVQKGTANLSDVEGAIKESFEAKSLGNRRRDFGNVASVIEIITVKSTIIWKYQSVRKETPLVDIDSVNNLYLYSNKQKRLLARLDLYDPAKGRILGTAQQDIDYTLSVDPAVYNKTATGSNTIGFSETYFWGPEVLGNYWWNIDNCRYIYYEYGSLDLRGSNWGKLFPGSEIEVYEWIESDVIPSVHVRSGLDGTPLYPDDSAYSEKVFVNESSSGFKSKYYFWVKNRSKKFNPAKTHSTAALKEIIESPLAQNIPFMSAIKDNAVALFNVGQFLNGNDTVLYVSSKRQLNDNIVHSDFALVQEGNVKSKWPEYLVEKLIDSISGIDEFRNSVPDTTLPIHRRFGIESFPRQSAIINQLKVKENVIKYVNSVLIKYQLVKKVTNSQGNLYANQKFDQRYYDTVVTTFNDLENPVPTNNLRILVLSDERNGFYWTIYRVVLLKTMQTSYVFEYSDFPRDYPLIRAVVSQLSPKRYDYYGYILTRRQGYDVAKFWSRVDWYADGYSKNTIANHIALNNTELYKIPLANGDLVRVLNVASYYDINVNYGIDLDNFSNTELYHYRDVDGQLIGELVGLNAGTFQFSEDLYKQWGFDSERFDTLGFDYDTNTEFRYVLKALQEEIFVDQLEIEWNRLLYYVMDLILGEQRYIDWFFKTSFISVNHNVNGLKQIPGYVKDRQQSFAEYINEVKPYRTKIREYKLTYNDIDLNRISISDFDLPAIWDTELEQFRSPNGDYAHDSILLQRPQYQDWIKNHTLYLESVDIVSSGYNYQGILGSVAPPSIVITRNDNNIGANAEVFVSVLASMPYDVSFTTVSNTGGNYILTPSLTVINNGADQLNDYLVHKFVVTSQGLNDTVAGTSGNVAFGLYSVNETNNKTTLFSTGIRSYTMHRIRRIDGQVVFSKSYDVFGTVGKDKELAQDLNNTTSDYIVVVHTYDEPQTNRLSNVLDVAMYRCGASLEVYGNTTDFKYRSAYILVGIAGCGRGFGIENYTGQSDNSSNAYCRLEFNVFRTQLIPVEAFPRIYTLGTAANFPANPLLGQGYQYGNKSWYWNGNTWVTNRSLVSQYPLTYVRENHNALSLAPRMANDVTRKIKTTIRFDRIRFTSSVQNWNEGVSYFAGTMVVYEDRLYEYKFDVILAPGTVGNLFPLGAVKEITDQNIFDNANDRIMAFYVPGPFNGYVPKLLNRLVSGLQTVSAITSEDNDPDTILIGDTFGSNAGISAGNIRVSGGTFVSEALTRSPEELVPGVVFESLTVKVQEANGTSGFRFFKDINGNISGTSYSTASTTSLAQPVFLFSSNIEVVDGTKLTAPVIVTSGNVVVSVTPGVILVNGERIAYYAKSGNTLQQIRRAYRGTSTPSLHLSGSIVEDVSTALSSTDYLTDFTKPVPPTPIGSWSVTSVTPTALSGNTFVFNYTAPSNAPGNVTVSWFAVDPGTITQFSNTAILGVNNRGYTYNLPITSTSGSFQINTVPIISDTQVFEVILTEGSIAANLLARSGTSNITSNVTTSPVVTGIQFVPGYYYEREYANQYSGLWSQTKTHQMESVTGLGSVNMHGPTFGSYILNLTDLPPHDEKKVSFIMHFVDSLDGETSTITLGNVIFAEFTKTGLGAANVSGAPIYTINNFAVSDWYPANYSYQPWGSGTTKNGYVVFESNWIASNSSSFSANIYLGHDEPQSDEAIYFSHFNLRLQGGNAVVVPSLPMPTLNFTFSNLTVPSGFTLVSNTFTTSNTVTIPAGVERVQITGRGADGISTNPEWQSTWITGDVISGPAFATVTTSAISGIPSSIIESDSQSQFNSLPDIRQSTGSNISFIHRTYNNQTLTETTYAARIRLKTGVNKLKSGSGWGSSFTTPSSDTRVYGVLATQYEEYRGGSSGADAAFSSVSIPGGRNGLVAPLTATSLAVTPGVTYPVTVPTGGIVNIQYLQPNTIVVPDSQPFKAAIFENPGTFTWTAPTGITKVHVLCVGGGGGGSYAGYGDAGGGGGGLGWRNFIPVTAGNSYTVVVGVGGLANMSSAGGNGGQSYFINPTYVSGKGGYGGGQAVSNAKGGDYIGQGGGKGGDGGITGSGGGAGGGGAGGWEGAGGRGGSYLLDGSNGTGGGGGGGAGQDGNFGFGGGAGGGVGLSGTGLGINGTGGEYGSLTLRNGTGGSVGNTSQSTYLGGAKGAIPGGGGGSGSTSLIDGAFGGQGGSGLVVIYYGSNVENLISSLPNINMLPITVVTT